MPLRRSSAAYLAQAEDLQRNERQWEAYSSEGHCAVLAGPGSGKTKTLTLKLARLLSESVRYPAGVACITYSQECARELDRRLDRLGVRDSANLFVGTIHSFCLRHIILPFGPLSQIEIPEPVVTASSGQQRAAFDDAVRRMRWAGRIPYGLVDLGRLRRVYLDEPVAMSREDADLARLVGYYIAALRRGGLVDYDDLVLLGLRLVREHDWCLKALAAKFPILAVDEYQDLGHPLDQLVRRLAFDGGVRLFAVGDVDQSIYGFTGADGALLTALAQRDDVQDVTLELNYRSATEIIQAAQLALGENRPYRAHDETRRATVAFHKCGHGFEAQAAKVVNEIIPAALAAKPGRTLGDIAVLYRAADVGNPVASALEAAGLRYIRTDNEAPYRRVQLTSWVEDMASWCAGGWRVGDPALSGLIRRYVGFERVPRERRRKSQEVVSFLQEWRTGTETSATAFVGAIRRDLVAPLAAREPSLSDQAVEVDRMAAAMDVGGALEHCTIEQLGGRDGDPSHLNMLTLHSAKGCEFQVVVMIGLEQGVFPWVNETGRKLLESRRLFYVGLTRAGDEVHLVYSGSYTDKRGFHSSGPSIFVRELRQRMGLGA